MKDRAGRGPDPNLAEAVLDRGLSVKTTTGTVLILTPPLVVSEAQMMDAPAILDEAIAAG